MSDVAKSDPAGCESAEDRNEMSDQRVMKEAFDKYRALLASSAKMHEEAGNSGVAAALRQGQGKIRDLLKLRDCTEPVVAFVGLTNAGKSTLLSALFGAKVAPMKNRPWSSVPVEYRFDCKYRVNVTFSDSVEREYRCFEDVSGLQDYIEQYATVGGGVSSNMLFAWMPAPILKSGLVIADTPGFGAAISAGGESQTGALQDYLPHADYVFWVIKSVQGVTRAELEFYKKCLIGRGNDIVVNCYDEFSAAERQKFASVNEPALGGRFRWHFVDAKSALKAGLCNDLSALEQSGMKSFQEYIETLAGTEARRIALGEQLVQLFADIGGFRTQAGTGGLFRESLRLNLQYLLENLAATGDNQRIKEAMLESINCRRSGS